MKKKWWMVAFGLLALIATVVVVINLSSKEPVYQGRSLSHWLNCLPATLAGGNGVVLTRGITWVPKNPKNWGAFIGRSIDEERAAYRAFEAAGTNAFPLLERTLNARETRISRFIAGLDRTRMRSAVRRIPEYLYNADYRRWQAVTAVMHVQGAPALVPDLSRMSQSADPQVRAAASFLIRYIDPEAAAKAGVK